MRRPRRAAGPPGLDGPAPARARVRAPVRGAGRRSRRPGARRIYSNAGFEVLGDALADAGRDAVRGLPARGRASSRSGSARDAPRARPAGSHAVARRRARASRASCSRRRSSRRRRCAEAIAVQFPGSPACFPASAAHEPDRLGPRRSSCSDAKAPHWTGTRNVAAHVRALRRQRHLPLGRPGGRHRARAA